MYSCIVELKSTTAIWWHCPSAKLELTSCVLLDPLALRYSRDVCWLLLSAETAKTRLVLSSFLATILKDNRWNWKRKKWEIYCDVQNKLIKSTEMLKKIFGQKEFYLRVNKKQTEIKILDNDVVLWLRQTTNKKLEKFRPPLTKVSSFMLMRIKI